MALPFFFCVAPIAVLRHTIPAGVDICAHAERSDPFDGESEKQFS